MNICDEIAKQTGHRFTADEVETALDIAETQFMQPDVQKLSASEVAEYIEHEDDEAPAAGYYWRLIAPGYLDCTDWCGPFESEIVAFADMLSMYGDDWLDSATDEE